MYREGCKVLRSNSKVSANANYLGEPREVNHVIDATRVVLRQKRTSFAAECSTAVFTSASDGPLSVGTLFSSCSHCGQSKHSRTYELDYKIMNDKKIVLSISKMAAKLCPPFVPASTYSLAHHLKSPCSLVSSASPQR